MNLFTKTEILKSWYTKNSQFRSAIIPLNKLKMKIQPRFVLLYSGQIWKKDIVLKCRHQEKDACDSDSRGLLYINGVFLLKIRIYILQNSVPKYFNCSRKSLDEIKWLLRSFQNPSVSLYHEKNWIEVMEFYKSGRGLIIEAKGRRELDELPDFLIWGLKRWRST